MLAIKNAVIHTMVSGTLTGGVLIDDEGRIQQVGALDIPEGTPVIDAAGRVLMPGMIDAHGHAGVSEEGIGPAGVDINETVDPITPHLRALDGINPEEEGIREALENGVTLMCVVPGSANVIGGEGVIIHMHGQTVDTMMLPKSGGLKIAFGENPKRVYGEQKKSPVTRMAVAALLREALVKAQNYQAKLEQAKNDPTKLVERDLKMDILLRVLNREIPVRAHAHRADDIMTALRIADEFNIRITVEHCTEGHKIVDELAKREIAAVIGPSLTTRSKVELKDRTFRTLRALWEGGVLFAITMDHPVNHVQHLPISAALAVREGLPEEEALKALTINPAKILEIDDDYGSVEPGKVADLVLWSGEPLDIRSKALKVLVRGEVVFDAEQ